MKFGKALLIGGLGLGFFFLYRKMAYAEELKSETIAASLEPEGEIYAASLEQLAALERKITSLEQIVQEAKTAAPPEIICREVIFTTIVPFFETLMVAAAIRVATATATRVAVETICGYDLETIREKAKERAATIFEPLKASFVITD